MNKITPTSGHIPTSTQRPLHCEQRQAFEVPHCTAQGDTEPRVQLGWQEPGGGHDAIDGEHAAKVGDGSQVVADPSGHAAHLVAVGIGGSYLGAAALFILALGGLKTNDTARRGNLFGIIGMAIATWGVLELFAEKPAAP